MSLRVSRILHAGYIFDDGATTIAFDPIFENPFSRNCHAFPDVKFDLTQIRDLRFSAIFISHFHDDHCSFDSLNLIDRETPVYLYCIYEELFQLLRELGFKKVYPMEINIPIPIGEFTVIPRLALDADVDAVFQIKHHGLNILNVVDAWIDPSALRILSQEAPFDLVLWPFQTMREIQVLSPHRYQSADREIPHEWIEQLRDLNPRIVVPSSCQFKQEPWSWYNSYLFPITYKQFEKQVRGILPDATVLRLNPSVTISLQENSFSFEDPLVWMSLQGDQELDYFLDENQPIPATSEVAQRFPALSPLQEERVLSYCHEELVQRFNALPVTEEEYFHTPRHWQLRLYDNFGQATTLHFQIFRNQMIAMSTPVGEVAWSTDIISTKLFAALEYGESLTSLYLRVNEYEFQSQIELEVSQADIIEDPLIRCLYADSFAAYQRAQLKRLKDI